MLSDANQQKKIGCDRSDQDVRKLWRIDALLTMSTNAMTTARKK